ncbi:WD40-repeat-containing domain protein [Microdochium trichocladiopsis]|uniref:WD40-repeat-containing domain protein n=1 Tax=Microdochium trichocladiopsis TaxID=1682393 RepID=A0A9P8XZH8_9PEZI|nr:WD40-repeat-containing domain protein [Microdochium trichocladiopsis]KAH7026029.1 WD40-repeat-containing domain protein [Microdochium trichocladiopsis]
MSLAIDKILAAAPVTARGQPTPLSTDAKGERIAYASGKSIFVRSIDNPSDCKQYTNHTAQTTVARFSPSGFYIASGDVSGAVKVWDSVEAVNTKGEYHIISGRINDIAWDGESQRIIAVGDGRERFGHCITADSGNSVGEISGHSKVINAVAMRASRPFRAVTVSDDMTVCFLHGAPFKFNSKSTEHKGFVMGAAYSPDGNTFVTVGADRKIQLYDGKTGEPTRSIGEGEHTGSIFAVSWAQDSKRFVTASADQTVKLWDVEAGKVTQSWRFGGDGVSVQDQQVGVVFPHGRSDGLIISLNLNGDLNYLKEGSAEPVKVVQGHNKAITALGVASDGKSDKLWTGSFDGKVCSWDVSAGVGAVVDGQTHTNQVVQFGSDAGRAYSVGWDDTLRIVDESANTFAGESTKLAAQPKGIAAANGRVYVATGSGVEIYEDGKLAGQVDIAGGQPTAIAAHGSLVAVGTAGNAVQLFDAAGGSKLSLVAEAKNSLAQISALAFSKDGSHLAAGASNGKIYAYKTSSLPSSGSLDLATDRWSAHTGRVTSIAWNEAGTHAASGALDTNVFVWSLAKPGSRVKALNAHKDGVYGVAWVGAGRVASTGGDAAIKIWSASGLQ